MRGLSDRERDLLYRLRPFHGSVEIDHRDMDVGALEALAERGLFVRLGPWEYAVVVPRVRQVMELDEIARSS